MTILLLDTVTPKLTETLSSAGYRLREEYHLPVTEIPDPQDVEGIIIRSRVPLGKAEMRHFPKLRFIARFGSGRENIDLIEAEGLGIEIFHAAEGNSQAVAEMALGSLLSLFRNIHTADREVRRGIWKREENRGIELQGRTVGIVGYGNTGAAFAKVLSGFGVRILAYDKYVTGFGNEYVEEADLNTLYRETEILSLHLPYNLETKYWLDFERMEDFSKNLYLINTSRGHIIRTTDLVEALENGKVLGACLDVYEYEKSSFESLHGGQTPTPLQYLLGSDKVILSPHIAGWTFESDRKMAEILFRKISERFPA